MGRARLLYFFTDSTLQVGGATIDGCFTCIEWQPGVEGDIQVLEIAAVAFALATFAPFVHGRRLICYTDNQGNVYAYTKGASRLPGMHAWICLLYWMQLELQCELRFVFVPGHDNAVADYITQAPLKECVKNLARLQYLAPI